jgi:hypothetical protein
MFADVSPVQESKEILRELERRRYQAMTHKDFDTLRGLFDDRLTAHKMSDVTCR